MIELLSSVGKNKYEGPKSKSKYAFRYYNSNEIILGTIMNEYLKFDVSYWDTLCASGVDQFSSGTMDKRFGGSNLMEIAIKQESRNICSVKTFDSYKGNY